MRPAAKIDALDPGGFGAPTITKSIALDGGGQVARVLVAGANRIVVAAQPSDVVTIRYDTQIRDQRVASV